MHSKQLCSGLAILALLILYFSIPTKAQVMYGKPYPTSSRFTHDNKHDTNNGLLDTFSLSFVGNLNFANAVEGVYKIVEGIASFIDLKVIKATVELVVDRFLPPKINLLGDNEVDMVSRIDANIGPDGQVNDFGDAGIIKKDLLKEGITTMVGAVLDKQQCWERTACFVGKRTRGFAAKDVVLVMAEKLLPTWNYTLDVVRQGSIGSYDCEAFSCSPEDKAEGH